MSTQPPLYLAPGPVPNEAVPLLQTTPVGKAHPKALAKCHTHAEHGNLGILALGIPSGHLPHGGSHAGGWPWWLEAQSAEMGV